MKTYFADPELKVIQFETKDICAKSNPESGDNETPIIPWRPSNP